MFAHSNTLYSALRVTPLSTKQKRRQDVRMAASQPTKTGVLFVCLGNICRSPTAEAVFTDVVKKVGKQSMFDIDSCGTGGGNPSWYKEGGWSYHEGEDADSRMSAAARKRGVVLTSKSRPLRPDDFNRFQYIVGMDSSNIAAMKGAAQYWKENGADIPDDVSGKVLSMSDFCTKHNVNSVPDPYYGGPQGFEKVLDLLDDACTGLLKHIEKQ